MDILCKILSDPEIWIGMGKILYDLIQILGSLIGMGICVWIIVHVLSNREL